MSDKFVVGYDGSVSARRALEFAVERARAQGGTIVIAHVLEWSPYSFLSASELEERHKRRREEMARAEEMLNKTVVAELKDAGMPVEVVIRYGSTGCNRFIGDFTLTGEGLAFGALGSTLMACSDALMAQERQMLDALENVRRFDLGADGALHLIGGPRDEVLIEVVR
ncbi:heat shock protein HslJ [Roseovarius sp. MBR-79]|jgi:heat shock protein HslJ